MAQAIPQRKDFVPGRERFVARATSFLPVGSGGDRKRQFLASDASIDRMGDTIAVEGWDLEPFKLNPVVLYVHDNQSIPIGKAEVWTDDEGLHCLVDFDDDDDADKILKKVDKGTLRAVSVGFMPKPGKSEYRNPDDKINDPGGIDFLEQELLEISIVPVPANAHALAEARTKAMGIKATQQGDHAAGDIGEHIKALAEHVGTLGQHVQSLGDIAKAFAHGQDAVDGGGNNDGGKAFAAVMEKAGLTATQKEAVLGALKATPPGMAMHPEVAKHVIACHKSATKALNLHNGAASAAGTAGAAGGDQTGELDRGRLGLWRRRARRRRQEGDGDLRRHPERVRRSQDPDLREASVALTSLRSTAADGTTGASET